MGEEKGEYGVGSVEKANGCAPQSKIPLNTKQSLAYPDMRVRKVNVASSYPR